MAETLQARIATSQIVAQAQIIINDAKAYVAECIARGETAPAVRVPEIVGAVWICRWRKFWNLTLHAITCSYTVSFTKKLMRLGVSWRNSTRLLVFHELLFGAGRLTFLSIDEKPYRFNAAGGDKVWARRGQRSVRVLEKRVALLERWTGITGVYSQRYGESCSEEKWLPKWAALFKAVDGSRTHVTPPNDSVQILFAEHGSVTTESWLEYLEFILPVVEDPADAVVVITDWYAPHLDQQALDFTLERTLSPTVMLGGGTTGQGAVCDKTPHRILAKSYIELESRDHTAALTMKHNAVPKWTKQDVLNRGYEAWCELDHECGFLLHQSHGYTTAIEHEDHLLDSSILQFWHHSQLDMPTTRKKLRTQVEELFESKIITEWADAWMLMEPHDNHRAGAVGEEAGLIVDVPDDEDDDEDIDDDWHDDDGDDGDDGRGGERTCLSNRGEKGGVAQPGDDGADVSGGADGSGSGGHDGSDHADEACQGGLGSTHASENTAGGLPAETVEEEASRLLDKSAGPRKRAMLEQIARTLESLGESSVASEVRTRLRKLRKHGSTGDHKLCLALKKKAVIRNRKTEEERKVVAAQEREVLRLQAEAKAYNLKTELARVRAREAASHAKIKELDLKQHAESKKAKMHRAKIDQEVTVANYATHVVKMALQLSGLQRRAMAKEAERKVGCEMPVHLPACWPKNVDKKTLKNITAYKFRVEPVSYASEAFSWKLFNEKRPQEFTPLHAAPSTRLGKLLDDCLPGWGKLLGKRWTPLDLLKLSHNCADAAFLNMVHMYKRVLGPKVFPPDVFEWPPHEWLASYHSKKRLRGTKTLVVAGSLEPATKSRRLSGKTAASPSVLIDSSSSSGASSSSSSKIPTDITKTAASSSCPEGSSSSSSASSSSIVSVGILEVPGCQLEEAVAPDVEVHSLMSKWSVDASM